MITNVSVHDVNDVIKVAIMATDEETGELVDPETVTFTAKKPDGTLVSYTYGVHTELQRTGVGQYFVALTVDAAGIWRYRWGAGGVGGEAEEGTLYVAQSSF